MLSDLTRYRHDPIRGRLAPKLARLMEASRAQYCALVWCALERPAEFHPYLTLGTDGKSKLQSLPKELEQISRRESLTGRLELLEWLAGDEQLASVPVIMLTGSEDPKHARQAYALGVRRYLIKPLTSTS